MNQQSKIDLSDRLRAAARSNPWLVIAPYRGQAGSLQGHCYTLTEILYHAWGKDLGFTPAYLTHETFPEGLKPGETHWYLIRESDQYVYDITAEQFAGVLEPGDLPPWKAGKRCGFLTADMSKRSVSLLALADQIKLVD